MTYALRVPSGIGNRNGSAARPSEKDKRLTTEFVYHRLQIFH